MQRILKGLRKKFDCIWLYNSSTTLDEWKTTHKDSAKQKKTSEQSNHVHSRFDIVPRRLIQIVHLTVWVTPNNSSSHFWANKFCCILGRVPHHLGSNMTALPKMTLSILEDPFCGCVLFFGFVDMMLNRQSTNCKQLIHTFDGFLNSQPPPTCTSWSLPTRRGDKIKSLEECGVNDSVGPGSRKRWSERQKQGF